MDPNKPSYHPKPMREEQHVMSMSMPCFHLSVLGFGGTCYNGGQIAIDSCSSYLYVCISCLLNKMVGAAVILKHLRNYVKEPTLHLQKVCLNTYMTIMAFLFSN